MGYGTVVSGGADGRYLVELDMGTASRDVLIAELDAKLAELNGRIAEKQTPLDAAEAETAAARVEVGVAIDVLAMAMQSDPQGDHKALQDDVDKKLRKVVELEGKAAVLRIDVDMLKADRANMDRQKTVYAGLALSRTEQVWCADLTEDASGEVATIEVPGEPQSVLIAPGGRAWTQAADGLLLNRALMTPEQAFFNAAILPGWQKWRPTYRKGTVTAVDYDADTADVELDATPSTAQDLPINQAAALTGVPVEYMTCNAAVFEPGDRCVVQFEGQDWASPKLVGFAEWPKACDLVVLALHSGGGLQPKISCVVAMSPAGAIQKQWVNTNFTHVAIGGFGLNGVLCYERGSEAAGGFPGNRGIARQTGGDVVTPVDVVHASFDGTEIYGLVGTDSGGMSFTALDAETFAHKRTFVVPYAGTELLNVCDSWDGMVVVSGGYGNIFVMNGVTGETLNHRVVPGGSAAVDVAIHRRLVCSLEFSGAGYNVVVRRRSDYGLVAAEFLSDAFYEAITTAGDYVFVQARKHPLYPVPVCRVYKVDDDGVSMGLVGVYEPFADFLADHPTFDSSRAGAGH